MRDGFKSIILSEDTTKIETLLTQIGHPELITKIDELRTSILAKDNKTTKSLLNDILSTPGMLSLVKSVDAISPAGFDEAFVSPAIMNSV